MLMGKVLIMLCLLLSFSGPLRAEWPERTLTLVSGLPPTLPWAPEQANPQALIVESLVPRLSRELGVPVTLVNRPQGHGVLAANLVAGARPDGYLVGALNPDQALIRVIQGYTPYTWDEIAPAATAWRVYSAIVVRADFQAEDLQGLAQMHPAPRLAHTGLAEPRLGPGGAGSLAGRKSSSNERLPSAARPGDSPAPAGILPLDSATYLALSAARAAGFAWRPVRVDRLDPALLLEDRADAMVLPLGWLERHPQAGRFKVLTILTHDENPPCGRGRPTLASQGLNWPEEEPPLAFYLPAKVNWRIRNRLLTAINNALRQPAVARSVSEACLKLYIEDLDGSVAAMERAYKDIEKGLAILATNGAR